MAWTYAHPDISVVVGTADYTFVPPTGAVVHAVKYADFDGNEIDVNVAESNIPIWDWRNQTGTPQYVLGGSTGITLVPTPNVPGTLVLTVILKPSPASSSIDDSMFNEYREAIVHGALARLMYSPKKPYTDFNLAAFHERLFQMSAASASIRAARNYTREPLETTIMRRRYGP